MWTFLESTEPEQQAWPDLDAARAAAGPLVQPANRLREVRTVPAPDGGPDYFLKVFHRTQAKNRLHQWLSTPRARCDAEREALVTAALRARGVRAPRPVAWGRRGASSAYLCAALPGTPAAEGWRGRAEVADAVAAFCGRLLRDGIDAPDLSADHVFLPADDAGDGDGTFGILDLTNATLRGNPAGERTARRVLRRFRRSVRDQTIPRATALKFAVRLLRAAGHAASTRRRLVRALPPWDTHGRYDVAGKSAHYRDRDPRRTAAELGLLEKVWPGRPGDVVWDGPCGTGRLAPTLVGWGARYVGGDRAQAMLLEAVDRGVLQPALAGRLVHADAAALPLADASVDGAVVFRFLHHLPPAEARAVVLEATRIARRFVVISSFRPLSLHGIQRAAARRWRGAAPTRFALSQRELARWCAESGFLPHRRAAQPGLRDFQVASFVRSAPPDAAASAPHGSQSGVAQ